MIRKFWKLFGILQYWIILLFVFAKRLHQLLMYVRVVGYTILPLLATLYLLTGLVFLS